MTAPAAPADRTRGEGLTDQSTWAEAVAPRRLPAGCRNLAAIAGLSETTVRNAIREARQCGLITVEERCVAGFRNLPNIVRIVSREWTA